MDIICIDNAIADKNNEVESKGGRKLVISSARRPERIAIEVRRNRMSFWRHKNRALCIGIVHPVGSQSHNSTKYRFVPGHLVFFEGSHGLASSHSIKNWAVPPQSPSEQMISFSMTMTPGGAPGFRGKTRPRCNAYTVVTSEKTALESKIEQYACYTGFSNWTRRKEAQESLFCLNRLTIVFCYRSAFDIGRS